MRSARSNFAILVALVVLMVPLAAQASTIGPLCWEALRNPSYTLRLFFLLDSANPVAAAVAGTDAPVGEFISPVSGSAAIFDGSMVEMALTIAPSLSAPVTFMNVRFHLDTLHGFYRCEGGTGPVKRFLRCDGQTRDWTPIPCER